MNLWLGLLAAIGAVVAVFVGLLIALSCLGEEERRKWDERGE